MKLSKSFNTLMASAVTISIAATPVGFTPAFAQSAPAAEAPGDSGWQKEFELWRTANKGGEVADFQTYLRLYPRGKFANVAKARIAELNAATQTVAENDDTAAVTDTKNVPAETSDADNVKDLELWRQVSKSGKQADYEKYLKQFPKGKFAKVASTRIKALIAKAGETPAEVTEDAAADVAETPADDAAETATEDTTATTDQATESDAAETTAKAEEAPAAETATTPSTADWEQEYAVWKAASDGNTVAEYESYLKAYPTGKFAAIAQARIIQLAAAETPDPNVAEGDDAQQDQAQQDQAQPDETQQDAGTDAASKQADEQDAVETPAEAAAKDESVAEDAASTQEATSGKTSGDDQTAFTEGSEDSENDMLDREARHEVQGRLSSLGYDTLGTDGDFGPRTRDAIASWQQDNGAPVTGFLSEDQINAIFAMSAVSYARWVSTATPIAVRRVRPRAELVVVRPLRQKVVVVKRRPAAVVLRPGAGIVKFKSRVKFNKIKVKRNKCRKRNRC